MNRIFISNFRCWISFVWRTSHQSIWLNAPFSSSKTTQVRCVFIKRIYVRTFFDLVISYAIACMPIRTYTNTRCKYMYHALTNVSIQPFRSWKPCLPRPPRNATALRCPTRRWWRTTTWCSNSWLICQHNCSGPSTTPSIACRSCKLDVLSRYRTILWYPVIFVIIFIFLNMRV